MGFGDEIPKQVWSCSLPPPVAEAGRRRMETARSAARDYAGFPGRQPNLLYENVVSEQADMRPTIEAGLIL